MKVSKTYKLIDFIIINYFQLLSTMLKKMKNN